MSAAKCTRHACHRSFDPRKAAEDCGCANNVPALRFSEAHGANQSPPLMPAQPKNTEQPTGDRRGLRNDGAIYPDVVDNGLEILAL